MNRKRVWNRRLDGSEPKRSIRVPRMTARPFEWNASRFGRNRFAFLCSVMWLCILVQISSTADAVEGADGSKREYFSVDIETLTKAFDRSMIIPTDDPLPKSFERMNTSPHLVLPPDIEAYVDPPEPSRQSKGKPRIIGARSPGREVRGRLLMLQRDPDDASRWVLAGLDWQVPADSFQEASENDFVRARAQWAHRLWSEQVAGAAVFRHLAIESFSQLGEAIPPRRPTWAWGAEINVDSTFRLMSGGRAVSENLALDQSLAVSDSDDSNLVSLNNVRGIRVQEMNWETLLKEDTTELDPLATLIPHNQYSVFLPTFNSLTQVVDRWSQIAKPAVQWFEPQSRKRDVLAFYQNQLGLPLNQITRQVGKLLIDEVALTGSDPYFRSGTDIAVLMHSAQPDLLHKSILTQVVAESQRYAGVEHTRHTIDHGSFEQWKTIDRRFCSAIARVGDAVVVSNSAEQMRRILSCSGGSSTSVGQLDEYRFFRQQYPRSTRGEAALVVITDAAIRRWCGPQWRIAASRRTRARAAIADLTAKYADNLVHQSLDTTIVIDSPTYMPGKDQVQVVPTGVISKTYGTLDFQTPIVELDLQTATKEEVRLYGLWRDRYERRWRRVFDPIGLQLTLDDDRFRGDLTVIPLVLQTQYQFLRDWVGDTMIPSEANDQHAESLASFSIAVDLDATWTRFVNGMLSQGGNNLNMLSWIDDSVTIYFDHDTKWLDRLYQSDPWETDLQRNGRDLPYGVFIPSRDNLRLAAFVVALRTLLSQASPNLIHWESAKHRSHDYVIGRIDENAPFGGIDQRPTLYYVTTPKGLTLSLNREVILRAIDRQLPPEPEAEESDEPDSGRGSERAEKPSEKTVGNDSPSDAFPSQLQMDAVGKAADVMARANSRFALRRMNHLACSNIPILNYFRKRYPDRDPFDVYESLFGEQLVEPTGGQYQWIEDRDTYRSSLHGYHLEPKPGPVIPPTIGPEDRIRTQLRFDQGGLRARMDVTPAPSATP